MTEDEIDEARKRGAKAGIIHLDSGIIHLDSERAKILGFTSDKYDGYLWKLDNAVMVSFIVSKQRGNFRELVRRIHALGLTVKVPAPICYAEFENHT